MNWKASFTTYFCLLVSILSSMLLKILTWTLFFLKWENISSKEMAEVVNQLRRLFKTCSFLLRWRWYNLVKRLYATGVTDNPESSTAFEHPAPFFDKEKEISLAPISSSLGSCVGKISVGLGLLHLRFTFIQFNQTRITYIQSRAEGIIPTKSITGLLK